MPRRSPGISSSGTHTANNRSSRPLSSPRSDSSRRPRGASAPSADQDFAAFDADEYAFDDDSLADDSLDERFDARGGQRALRFSGSSHDATSKTAPRPTRTLPRQVDAVINDDVRVVNTKRAQQIKTGVKSSSKKPARKPDPPRTPPRALAYEVAGVLLLAVGGLLAWNARFPLESIRGVLPRAGVTLLRYGFGSGAVVIPLLVCLLGAVMMIKHHRTNLRAFGRGATVAFLVFLTAIHLAVPHGHEWDSQSVVFDHGGYVGGLLARVLRSLVGDIGAIISLVALSLVALLFWSEISLAQMVSRVGGFVSGGARHAGRGGLNAARRTRETLQTYYGDYDDWNNSATESRILPREILEDAQRSVRPMRKPLRDRFAALKPGETTRFGRADDLVPEELISAPAPVFHPAPPTTSTVEFDRTPDIMQGSAANEPEAVTPATPAEPTGPRIEFTDAAPPESVLSDAPPAPISTISPEVNGVPVNQPDEDLTPTEALEAQAQASATAGEAPKPKRPEGVRRRFGDGPLMPPYFDDAVRALDPPLVPDLAGADEDIQQGVQSVTETLASFKIDARVTDVKRGPVITRYEVQPAAGVRVAAIANLDRDMARALSAIAVRIEAPVPGKNVVGIEVPNKKVHLVRLRDVLERHDFLAAPSKLSFVLGKDIAGQPKWGDLTKMPHMLIAGSTNSGKSVCLNSIIASILVRATPDEVKFSLIDPKRVELTLFKGIKHLYHPVVVEPKDAVKALRGAIAEMDRRYKSFAERGVRNIVSYNSKLEEGEKPLPYLVIVIDELADLMMTAAAEFEKLICRIAQLARATGIHLIVATQRPSVNVITGVIKANIPSRVAFAVASQVDSRTILDSIGAERLIGSGDMLFDANNGGKAVRIQGAYLSEEEVNRIVEVVKDYYDDEEPEYGMDLSATDDDEETDTSSRPNRDDKKDELYDEILEYVVRSAEMSASMIQRKFEIGYPRAARIVDQFERDGVLSGANGSKPRKVIGNGRGASMEE
ncbi:MAG TPA: DNA translocase FtsK [Abditibacteriaceae bacterium]|jgi:S-DNA-T family DNA segregation ATPase FtsK/SpoIIIE